MFAEGIFPIGDGLLDIDEERLKDLLVPHDINEIYEVEQTPFARGKFAAVRRAIHKNSGTHFAAKFLKRRRRAQSSDKEIKHEIAVLMLCNEADNIVKLNAVHESRSDTALLLELATGGELQTFLDNEECLSEAQARICMRQVLKALQFLHKRSIVHLDLKPQNILLAGERIEDGLKLCDFGISRVVAEGTNVREIVGTPDYVAPEVLQYEPLSLLTDIWSVGVLAYVLLSGFSPFGGETKQETFLNISQCALTFPDKLFGGVSSAAIDFIRKALRIKPTDRMTAAGCLEHIWLKDECNIDRHIFNAITNKQQLEHDDDDDEEDDVDDDEEDDADVDVDDEDHVVDVDVANDVEAEDNDQQNEEVVKETKTNTIADDDDVEVQIIKDKLPQAISVDNSEEEDNNTSNNSFTKTVNKPFSKSTNTTINNTTTHHHHQQQHHSSSNGGLTNGHSKSHSNNSLTNGHSNGLANGHHHDYTTNGYANGHISAIAAKGSGYHMYNSYTKLREDLNDKSAKLSLVRPSMSATTTKTTAVHNVAATTKAITIPLCSVQPQLQTQQQTLTTTPPQEQQQQQLLHIPARRHSSESNKENTFLTTKKITANNISNGSSSSQATLKKTSTSNNSTSTNSSFSSSPSTSLSSIPNTQSATATATIHITPNPTLNNNSNIVATITLPTAASVSVVNGVNISSDKTVVNTATANNHHSLFPDAPTTPKVIRKAPTTDASPTSVKALVKKFQLEGGDQTITPPEFATNGSKHNHQQHQQQQQQQHHHHHHQLHNQSQTKYNNVRSTLSPPTLAHSSAITIMNSSRRASEPITAIHMNNNNNNNNNSNKKITSTSAPVSIPASAANNFKTTCVYCVSCTNSLTNGCRHPNSSTNNISTSLATSTTTTATTKYSSNNHSSSTKSLNNAVGNATSSNNTAGGNSCSGSSSSQALLFGQHTQHLMNSSHHQQQQQQQQHLNNHHHHHHHHTHHHLHHHGVVVKNANASANGLSLDQGIIC